MDEKTKSHVILGFDKLEDLNKLKSAITRILERMNYSYLSKQDEENLPTNMNASILSVHSVKTPPKVLQDVSRQTIESMSSEEEKEMDLKVFLHPYYFM